MNVKLISITPDIEKTIVYIARVSNPDNQNNPDYEKLIKYLLVHKHYSPFEHGFMTVEIKTSRAIATQILRHRSFSFQEFSQRYSSVTEFEPIELRKQATKNRQSSTDVFNPMIEYGGWKESSDLFVKESLESSLWTYNMLLAAGVAKESARMVLPLTTQTTLYMSGSIRSFIHYVLLRMKSDTQKEHRLIAESIYAIMSQELPVIHKVLESLIEQDTIKELLYSLYINGTIKLP